MIGSRWSSGWRRQLFFITLVVFLLVVGWDVKSDSPRWLWVCGLEAFAFLSSILIAGLINIFATWRLKEYLRISKLTFYLLIYRFDNHGLARGCSVHGNVHCLHILSEWDNILTEFILHFSSFASAASFAFLLDRYLFLYCQRRVSLDALKLLLDFNGLIMQAVKTFICCFSGVMLG